MEYRAKKEAAGGHGVAPPPADDHPLPDDPLDAGALWDDVIDDREEIRRGDVYTDFIIGPRASKANLAKRRAELTDSYRCETRTRTAAVWADQYGIQKSFTISLTYGRDVCIALCSGFAARMQFFLDAWLADGAEDDYVYDVALETPMPAALVALQEHGSDALRARIETIWSMRPL